MLLFRAIKNYASYRWIGRNYCQLVKSETSIRNKGSLPLAPLHFTQRVPPASHLRYLHSIAVSLGRRKILQRNLHHSGFIQYSSVIKPKDQKMPEGKQFERLPQTIKPKHYVLSLIPDLKSFTFEGEVSIQIEVVEKTNEIKLNAIELEISKASLQGQAGLLTPKDIKFAPEDELATFIFSNPLSPGPYSLDIVFKGTLNDKMKGLYRSKYLNEKGEETYAAVTQFESKDARRCFPCWDEPALKATFDISLTVPKKLVALSNMPITSSKDLGELVRYQFETTPIMSTYLVAVVVGEYDYVEDRSADGVLVRVYTPKGKKEQGLFALEVATKVLPYYKEYFDIAYPLPKIDLIAIADFCAGAMENWGLVTYRETCLLVDPENTSAIRKQWIALVVGHELAHQWFGNLVTMEWWTHLWLNEGYASFVEFLCVNHLFPEYDIWTQFVTETYISALELDALKNSHPIEVPIGHPSEIDEIFDDISYSKGASVIRMLHHYIGDDDFRKGMNVYLTRHQYKNTFTEDLWAALEEASNKPVGAVMSTWTKQMGFPVVKVSTEKNKDGVLLKLSQEKFTADGSAPDKSYLWMIPISISTSKNPGKAVVNTVLKTKEGEILIPDVSENDWIKLNPGSIGFYRTKYTAGMLTKLIPAIKDKSLPPLDRLNLVDDLFAMIQAGHTSTVEVLKILSAFEDETDYTVWSSICNILGKLTVLIGHIDYEEQFIRYQKKLFAKIYQRLGWTQKNGETHLDTLLRGLVLGKMSSLDHDDAIKEARQLFSAHLTGSSQIPADLRSACYKTVLRAGGSEEFDTLLKLYRSTDLQEEKNRISRALGATKDPALLSRVLDFSMSEDVRSQDTVFVIMSVAITRVGRDLAWQFFKDNWTKFVERYEGSGGLLVRLWKCTTENYASEKLAAEVESFYQGHKTPGIERSVQQAIETIRLNSAWLERDSGAIKDYLKDY